MFLPQPRPCAGAALAHAQVTDPVEFTTSFPFTVGNTTMPAGSYEIRRDTDNGTVYRIESAEEAHRYALRGRAHLDDQAAGEDRGRLQALRPGLRAQVRVGGRLDRGRPDRGGWRRNGITSSMAGPSRKTHIPAKHAKGPAPTERPSAPPQTPSRRGSSAYSQQCPPALALHARAPQLHRKSLRMLTLRQHRAIPAAA